MDGLFEELSGKLHGNFSFSVDSKNLAINLDSLSKIRLSSTAQSNYVGRVPLALSDFFKNYFEKIKTKENIVFNELDVDTSSHCSFFKVYQRIVEKLFFDYCLVKGLKFSDYDIQKDIYFYNDFKKISFDYLESMSIFYIVMFLSLDKDAHDADCDLFSEKKDCIANGLPLIVPHSPDFYLNLSNSVPAMIIKVQGA